MQAKNEITVLKTVDSTNNYAMGQVHAGVAAHGQAWLALEQKQGKGQHGKTWQTAKGDNITMSVLLDASPLTVQQQFRLSAAVAAACHAFLHAYTGENVYIKWPNDLYWNDRKAGGILIENVLKGQHWKWAIAGIGLNINQQAFPENLPNPVSLWQITNTHYPVEKLSEELHQKVLFYYQQLISDNWLLIYHYYNRFLYKKDQPVRLQLPGRSLMGTIREITESGKLILAETNEEFDYGSVQIDWEAAGANGKKE